MRARNAGLAVAQAGESRRFTVPAHGLLPADAVANPNPNRGLPGRRADRARQRGFPDSARAEARGGGRHPRPLLRHTASTSSTTGGQCGQRRAEGSAAQMRLRPRVGLVGPNGGRRRARRRHQPGVARGGREARAIRKHRKCRQYSMPPPRAAPSTTGWAVSPSGGPKACAGTPPARGCTGRPGGPGDPQAREVTPVQLAAAACGVFGRGLGIRAQRRVEGARRGAISQGARRGAAGRPGRSASAGSVASAACRRRARRLRPRVGQSGPAEGRRHARRHHQPGTARGGREARAIRKRGKCRQYSMPPPRAAPSTTG